MKTNLSRLLCLVLAVLMSVAVFSACGKKKAETSTDVVSDTTTSTVASETEPTTEIVENTVGEGYTLTKAEGAATILLVDREGVRTFEVAENSTVEAFFKAVAPEEGFTLKLFGADGKEITDKAAIVADKSTFKVFDKDGNETKAIPVAVKSEEDIKLTQSAVKEQSAVNANSAVASNSATTPAANGLKGYKFKFGTTLASGYTDQSNATGKVNVPILNKIKSKYGCTIDIVSYNGATVAEVVTQETRAGKVVSDVVQVDLGSCRAIARNGALCDLSKCTTLNMNTFKNGMTESVTFKGRIFGVAYASMAENSMGILFNKDLVKKYSPKNDIYSLYKAGTWNFTNFKTVATDCTVDTNGDGTKDIFGVTSNTNIIGMALTANAGGTALKVNERVMATMCNEDGIQALEWMKEVYNAGIWAYKPDIYVAVSAFADGEAAMFASNLSFYSQIATTADFDMGYVPMPKGPKQSNYITGAYNGSLFIVPKTNKANLNVVGTFLNELSAASSGHITAYITNMAKNGLDATAQSVYKWSVTNTSPEYRPFDSTISLAVDQSVINPNKSPKQELEKIKNQAQAMCDDAYAPLYNYVD